MCIRDRAKAQGKSVEQIKAIIASLHEFNPMMGHHGLRLACLLYTSKATDYEQHICFLIKMTWILALPVSTIKKNWLLLFIGIGECLR